MSKTTGGYIIFAVASIATLWVILEIGSRLSRAPADLAGKWQIQPAGSAVDPNETLAIEQSGRYVQISFKQGPQVKYILNDQKTVDGLTTLTFEPDLTATGTQEDYTFHFPSRPDMHAHRIARTYFPVADDASHDHH